MFCHYLASKKQPAPSPQDGFGLVELLVSISILVLVTTVVLARQNAFNSALLLRNEAYSVALAIREIQIFAVSAVGDGTSFRERYGAHFSTAPGFEQNYRIFRDADDDGYYDVGEAFGRQGIIDSRFEVRSIRAIGDGYSGNGVSVIFERPNFDARFYDTSGEVNADRIEVDIALVGTGDSGPDVLRTLEITGTGQISVLTP